MADAQVTVCVPSYQSAGFLRATLDSLVKQTFTDWQCHLVDDASSDQTIEIAQEFAERDSRFLVTRNPQRLGAASNWNKAIEGVTSEYVKLLCSDDVLAPRALEATVGALMANPDATLAASRRDIIDEAGRTLWRSRGLWRSPTKITGPAAMRRFVKTGTNFFGEPSFGLYRTSALRKVGGFDTRWSYLIDVASYRDVLSLGSFVPVAETLGAFRVRGESWSASLIGAQARENQEMVKDVGAMSWVGANQFEIGTGRARAALNALTRRPFFWFAEASARGPSGDRAQT